MGHAEHGHTIARQRHHGVQHLLHHFRIEGGGGLVEEHDLGVHAQGARDGDALLLAAGQLAGIFVGLLGDLHPGQVMHGELLGLALGHFAHPDGRQGAILQNAQMGKQVEILEDHADLAADLVDLAQIIGQLHALHDDAPGLMLLQPVDAADQRRLARARGSADDDALALPHAQVDVAQHMELPIPFVDADHLDGGAGMG